MYIEMTVEEAMKIKGKNAKVLVAVQDLSNNDTITSFKPSRFGECENIIKSGETILKQMDDFVNQLKIFSYKQVDLNNIKNRGKMHTILFK